MLRSSAAATSSHNNHGVDGKSFLSTTAFSASAAAANQGEEFVTVLKLNMLQDNPGAVKTVRNY
jgi:hypothetical protein